MPERPAQRGRVLVVEDEAYVRDSLAEMLGARGFQVDPTPSAEAALAFLARAPVDVVLTDLKMPGGGGLELVRRLQAVSPEIPVVVLTGHGTVASAVECIKAGASDYILKPASPDALEVALERALAARALRREVTYLRGAAASGGAATGADEDALPVGRSTSWQQVMKMVSLWDRRASLVEVLWGAHE